MQRLIELLNLGDPAAALVAPASIFLAGAAAFGLLVAIISLVLIAADRKNALPPIVITLAILVSAACAVLILPQGQNVPPVAQAREAIVPLLPAPNFVEEFEQPPETPSADDFLIQDNE
jgi:ribose/xylose/arabinose/galactoside ABC-type transport system permease subunit